MNKIKKLIFSILLASVTFMSISPTIAATANAQTWFDQSFVGFYTKVYDRTNPNEIFGERYTAAQVQWIFWSMISGMLNLMFGGHEIPSCLLTNLPDLPLTLACLYTIPGAPPPPDPNTSLNVPENYTYNNPTTNDLGIFSFTKQPISGVKYLNNVVYKFNPIKDAQAQGFGFAVAADPVREIWQMTRDVAYFFLVLAAIIMAFMIMFRVKLNPQTVISVQSAIPRLVIALLLITFSYAIAGLLIDLMYLVIGLIALILTNASFTGNQGLSQLSVGAMFNELTATWGVFQLMNLYSRIFLSGLLMALFQSNLLGVVLAITLVVPLIILILVIIFLAILTIRILWVLLRAYVNILLLIIVGPFMILLGTVSTGRNSGGFTGWLRSLAANLAVYPATGLLFVLAFVFLKAAEGDTVWADIIRVIVAILGRDLNAVHYPFFIVDSPLGGGNAWAPPLTLGGGSIELIWLAVSLVCLTLIPNVANMIQGFISGQGFAFGTAIGQALTPIQAGWGATAPIRRYEAGRSVAEGVGPVGGTLSRLGVKTPRRESIAATIYGYRK